jgi:probable F420-dependent oxidoreductase
MTDSTDTTATAAAARERLGRVGVWFGALGLAPAAAGREVAAELDELGYGALWVGEALHNKESFAHLGILLAATRRITVASGIANIWVRDATAANNGADTLAEAYDDRFVLGLGVSHQPIVDTRGHDYGRPLAAMRAYLDALDEARYDGPPPSAPVPVVLAALRTRMLELARDRTAGAHPYFVPVEHTAQARETLGPAPVLAPELAVVLETDPVRARAIAREHTVGYLRLPNYVANLRTFGFDDADLANAGSDRLVDAIVAWGDVDAISARVRAHHEAGADHVAIQPLAATVEAAQAQLRELAPALLGAARA